MLGFCKDKHRFDGWIFQHIAQQGVFVVAVNGKQPLGDFWFVFYCWKDIDVLGIYQHFRSQLFDFTGCSG